MASNAAMLPYRYLGGQCGLKVSTLCFGTMTFGQVRLLNSLFLEPSSGQLTLISKGGREGVCLACDHLIVHDHGIACVHDSFFMLLRTSDREGIQQI